MTGVFRTTKKGRVYHYYRVPPQLLEFYGVKLIRLSDDRDEAEREVATLSFKRPRVVQSEPERKAVMKMMQNATARSKRKKLASDLDAEFLQGILRSQGYKCALSGLSFDMRWREGSGAKRNAFAPSLDRIDNTKGYTRDNCRIVLSALNYGMNEWGLDVYLQIARAVVGRTKRVENYKPRSKLLGL